MQGLDSAPEEHSFLEILNQREQLTILRMFNHVFQSQDLYVILPPLLLQLSGTIVDRSACMNGAVGGGTRIFMSSHLRWCRRGNRSFSGWASSLDPTRWRVIGCSLENRAPGASSDCITGKSKLTRKAGPWPRPHGSLNLLKHIRWHFQVQSCSSPATHPENTALFTYVPFKIQEECSLCIYAMWQRSRGFISCSELHPAAISTDERLTRKDGDDQQECEQPGD